MAATADLKAYTGTGAATETAAGNWNLMSIDSYDTSGVQYRSERVQTPTTGSAYSYERWLRLKFSGSFTSISDLKVYHSAGTLSDANFDLLAGTTTSAATPITTASAVATTTLTGWDSVGEAINISVGGAIIAPGYSNYLVIQFKVTSSATTSGDIGNHTLYFMWTES
jgi:hypothetical protein